MKMVDERVIDIISEYSRVEKELVKPESFLVGGLEIDSLDEVEITMALEEKFGIEIPDEVTEKFTTVGEVIEYVQRAIGTGPA